MWKKPLTLLVLISKGERKRLRPLMCSFNSNSWKSWGYTYVPCTGGKEILEIAICNSFLLFSIPLAHFFFQILLLNVIKGLKVYVLELN